VILAGELLRIETMPRALAVARTVWGRLVLVAGFTALLGVLSVAAWWQTGVVLVLTSLFPERRRLVVMAAALCWIYLAPPLRIGVLESLAGQHGAERWLSYWPLTVALVWMFVAAYIWLGRRFPASPIGRRPLVGLLVVLVALLAAHPISTGLGWVLVTGSAMVLSRYLWFFAYWIADGRAKRKNATSVPLGYARPFWGFTNVPFGKGAAYLERVEARGADQLAAVQLKGLKLLVWALVLSVVSRASHEVLWGSTSFSLNGIVPTFETSFERHLQGDPDPLWIRWLAVIVHFLFDILGLAILGHKIIAICRMAGFNVFRNTYRPLTAPTIAEFYNRVHYYFKELLATFFFYPTYLRYFKGRPRLRLFVATLAAAGFGNFLFHFLQDDSEILHRGWWNALVSYHVYGVYALVLGIGIGLSQARARGRQDLQLRGFRRVRAIAGVLLFYCIMSIFDVPSQSHTALDYGSYVLSLFRP
jgi:hypothetical protein